MDRLLEDPVMLRYPTKLYGLDQNKAEMVTELTEFAGEGYLAFTPGTPDLVRTYVAALEKVQAGQVDAGLLKQYGLARVGHRLQR